MRGVPASPNAPRSTSCTLYGVCREQTAEVYLAEGNAHSQSQGGQRDLHRVTDFCTLSPWSSGSFLFLACPVPHTPAEIPRGESFCSTLRKELSGLQGQGLVCADEQSRRADLGNCDIQPPGLCATSAPTPPKLRQCLPKQPQPALANRDSPRAASPQSKQTFENTPEVD